LQHRLAALSSSPSCNAQPDILKASKAFGLAQTADASMLSSAMNVVPSARPLGSVCSAPPILPSACHLKASDVELQDGNCLPMSSRVWVENKGMLDLVSCVASGDRILCHDNLTGAVKYASVISSQTLEADVPVPWVTVTLEDGQSLDVTADHPLMAWHAAAEKPAETEGATFSGGDQYRKGHHVYAGNLKEGEDTLMMLKTVNIPVKSVEHRILPAAPSDLAGDSKTDSDASRKRVALVVQQPERHSILVSFGASGSGQNFTAVGSSGVSPQMANRIVVKNTFICDEETASDHRRASSEPPTLRAPRTDISSASDMSDPEQPPQCWEPTPDISPDPSFVSSGVSSSVSCISSTDEPTVIRICGDLHVPARREGYDEPQAEARLGSAVNAVTLSEYQQLRTMGAPSVGSTHGHTSDCIPCAFHAKKQRRGADARDCYNGVFCDFCHVDGHVQQRSAYRKLRRVGNLLGDLVVGRKSSDEPTNTRKDKNKKANKLTNEAAKLATLNNTWAATNQPAAGSDDIISKKQAAIRIAPEMNIQGVPLQ